MTAKLFWTDPYLTTLDTTITSVTGDMITLQETIFYAFSGGQERIEVYLQNKAKGSGKRRSQLNPSF